MERVAHPTPLLAGGNDEHRRPRAGDAEGDVVLAEGDAADVAADRRRLASLWARSVQRI